MSETPNSGPIPSAGEPTMIERLKHMADFLSSIKIIISIMIAIGLLLWSTLQNFSAKLDSIKDVKEQVEDLNANYTTLTTVVNRIATQQEMFASNSLSIDRKVVVLEERNRALEDRIRRAVDVNRQAPFKFTENATNSVSDGVFGGIVTVVMHYDVMRNECKPTVERVVKDADDIIHNVTNNSNTSFDDPLTIWSVGSNQTDQYNIRLPDKGVIKSGPAKYQVRVLLSCPDGGQFYAWSPYVNFKITEK